MEIEASSDSPFEAIERRLNPEILCKIAQLAQPDHRRLPRLRERLEGSDHLLQIVEFPDERKTIFRFPLHAMDERDDLTASVEKEVRLLKYLNEKTRIRVPQILGHSSSCANELGLRYILLEYVEGQTLQDAWYKSDPPYKGAPENWRDIVLGTLAAANVELGEIDPSFLQDQTNSGQADAQNELQVAVERFTIPKGSFQYGSFIFLQHVVNSVPFARLPQGTELAHNDLALVNFIMARDNGAITIIDWSDFSCKPKIIGSKRQPPFLIQDWIDPQYPYTEPLRWNSREELIRYRHIYAERIKEALPLNAKQDIVVTNLSPLLDTILDALGAPQRMTAIMEELLTRFWKIKYPDADDLDETRWFEAVGEAGKLSLEQETLVQAGLDSMIEATP